MKKIVALLMALIAIMSLAVAACSPSQEEQSPQETGQVSEKTDILKMTAIYDSLVRASINTGLEYDPGNPKFVWEALYYVLNNYGYGVTDEVSKKIDADGIYAPDPNNGTANEKDMTVTLDEMKRLMAACFGPDVLLPEIPEGFDKITVENNDYTVKSSIADPLTVSLYSYNFLSEDVCEVIVELKDDTTGESLGGFYLAMESNPDAESPYPLCVKKLYKHDLSGNRTKS